MIRETGAVPAKAGFELHVAAQECYEAAALPSRPFGEILPSAQPRLSLPRRVPVGVVGVISPFNVPLILSIRSVAPALALGNAVRAQARPAHRRLRRLHRWPACSRRPGCPTGCCTCCPAAPTSGEALVTDPRVRVISFTGSTAAGRRVGRAGRRGTSSGCTWSWAATRR